MLDENGKEVEAEIINLVEINHQAYVLLSVSINDEDANLYVNKVVKGEDGEEDIVPIEDDNERELVFSSIKEMIDKIA